MALPGLERAGMGAFFPWSLRRIYPFSISYLPIITIVPAHGVLGLFFFFKIYSIYECSIVT